MFSVFVVPVFASEKAIWIVLYSKNGDAYLENTATGENMYSAFEFDETGNAVYLNLKEYATILNSQSYEEVDYSNLEPTDVSKFKIQMFSTIHWSYKQISSSQVNGTRTKISADYKGEATISVASSITTSEFFFASVSLGFAQKSAVRGGASFGWTTTSSTSIGGSFTVPAGKIGYVAFTPYLNKTYGELWYSYIAGMQLIERRECYATAYSPIESGSGSSDGVYQLMIF